MFGRWFNREERRLTRALRAIDTARSAVESVIGLPHVLAQTVVARNFGNQAQASSEAFRETGKNGEWTLPSADQDLAVAVKGDDTGRLVLGLIAGRGDLQGLIIFTEWSRFAPQSEWQVQLGDEPSDTARVIYRRITGEAPQ